MAERPDILDTYSALPSDERLGFLVAIHSMPEFLQPSAWMGELRSEEVGFRDMEDAQAFFDALMELYNRVGQTLRSDSPTDDLYPDLEDPDAVARWCRGYLRAIDLQRTLPDEDDVTSVPLMLFAVLSGEIEPEEVFDTESPRFATIDDWLRHHRRSLPDHAETLWYQWEEERGMVRPGTVLRPGPKVGRNDPCPCGSGKKYKRCCLH